MDQEEEMARKRAACFVELTANDWYRNWSVVFLALGGGIFYGFLTRGTGTLAALLLGVGGLAGLAMRSLDRRAARIRKRIFER